MEAFQDVADTEALNAPEEVVSDWSRATGAPWLHPP